MAIAGAVVRWLKDNMGIVQSSSEIGTYTVASDLKLCDDSFINKIQSRFWGETLSNLSVAAGLLFDCIKKKDMFVFE